MAKLKDLDDLLEKIPGLRRCRSLNAAWLRTLLDRQRKECTWCGERVPSRSSTWCSSECVKAFKMRCCPIAQAGFVLDRDKGICVICERDTQKAESDFQSAWDSEKKNYGGFHSQYGPAEKRLKEQFGFARGRWREVDHILPVVEGGGLLGVGNLRTLCGKCHAKATKELSARRKRK